MMTATAQAHLLRPCDWKANKKDILGQRFGRLLVLFPAGILKTKVSGLVCRCDCGAVCVLLGNRLVSGATKSCGCSAYRHLLGKRHGALVVQRRIGREPGKPSMYSCLCDCGNTVAIPAWKLRQGKLEACSCTKSASGGLDD